MKLKQQHDNDGNAGVWPRKRVASKLGQGLWVKKWINRSAKGEEGEGWGSLVIGTYVSSNSDSII